MLDKYYLFALLYPEKFQKRYLKSKYKKVTNNIIRLPIEDIIFLFNATHIKTYKDIMIIISINIMSNLIYRGDAPNIYFNKLNKPNMNNCYYKLNISL